MTRAKKTEGEKIAANYATGMHPLEGRGLGVTIDRAIRRAQAKYRAKVWDECCDHCAGAGMPNGAKLEAIVARCKNENPYRGRKR